MEKTYIRLLGMLCLVLGFASLSFSQNIILVNTKHIKPENVGEYIHRESTYWKEVSKKTIAADRMTAWSVWQRIGGFDIHKDHNFVVVSHFTPEQFAKPRERTDLEKMFPGVKEEDIRVRNISTTQDVLFYRNLAYHELAAPNYIRVNFGKAKSRDYYQLEPEIWGPFIDKQMKAGKTSVVSWGFSVLSYPRGSNLPHDAVSVDGFNSFSDAISGSGLDDDVELPDNISKLMNTHEKVERIIYRLVASSNE